MVMLGLKAKFIFLGQENWKDMLVTPTFGAAIRIIPCLGPLVNVWFLGLKPAIFNHSGADA